MSTRMGMADGRCFTIHNSAQLYNDYIMTQNGISYEDNYSFRKLLQSKGPELLKGTGGIKPTECTTCNAPLLKISNIY